MTDFLSYKELDHHGEYWDDYNPDKQDELLCRLLAQSRAALRLGGELAALLDTAEKMRGSILLDSARERLDAALEQTRKALGR